MDNRLLISAVVVLIVTLLLVLFFQPLSPQSEQSAPRALRTAQRPKTWRIKFTAKQITNDKLESWLENLLEGHADRPSKNVLQCSALYPSQRGIEVATVTFDVLPSFLKDGSTTHISQSIKCSFDSEFLGMTTLYEYDGEGGPIVE
jgi:hypothetical protein